MRVSKCTHLVWELAGTSDLGHESVPHSEITWVWQQQGRIYNTKEFAIPFFPFLNIKVTLSLLPQGHAHYYSV